MYIEHKMCVQFLTRNFVLNTFRSDEYVLNDSHPKWTLDFYPGLYVLHLSPSLISTKILMHRETVEPQFVGASAKLRKAIISLVMSVRLSVLMEQLGSHWMDFHEIWY